MLPRMHWIPWVFVAGFGVVIAVNAVMIYFALSTFTGVAVEAPYQRGIAYNKVLAAQAKQDALGWNVEVSWRAGGDTPLQGEIRLRVADMDGKPVAGLMVEAAAHRPLEKRAALPLSFVYVGDGSYAAPAVVDAHGNWDIRLDARRGDDKAVLVKRLFVP